MSFTRLDYDKCAYAKFLEESTEPLDYQMYDGKHINKQKCGEHPNMLAIPTKVEIESDLRNLDRLATKCPSKKYSACNAPKSTKTTNPKLCERIPSGLKQNYAELKTEQPPRLCKLK